MTDIVKQESNTWREIQRKTSRPIYKTYYGRQHRHGEKKEKKPKGRVRGQLMNTKHGVCRNDDL